MEIEWQKSVLNGIAQQLWDLGIFVDTHVTDEGDKYRHITNSYYEIERKLGEYFRITCFYDKKTQKVTLLFEDDEGVKKDFTCNPNDEVTSWVRNALDEAGWIQTWVKQ